VVDGELFMLSLEDWKRLLGLPNMSLFGIAFCITSEISGPNDEIEQLIIGHPPFFLKSNKH
jgi:hypothetical protein